MRPNRENEANIWKEFGYQKIWDFIQCVVRSDWRLITEQGHEEISVLGVWWFSCVGLPKWR